MATEILQAGKMMWETMNGTIGKQLDTCTETETATISFLLLDVGLGFYAFWVFQAYRRDHLLR